jgi:osmotically inducible lipoprotein OsmB
MGTMTMRIIFAGCLAALLSACTTTEERIAGAAAGAGTGAIIGGPIGAVAGGAVGAFAAPTVTGSVKRMRE